MPQRLQRVCNFSAAVGERQAVPLAHHAPLHAARFVEVKSATDHLRQTQVEMLSRLKRIEKVTCSICCPNAARKRMAVTMEAFTESSDEEE